MRHPNDPSIPTSNRRMHRHPIVRKLEILREVAGLSQHDIGMRMGVYVGYQYRFGRPWNRGPKWYKNIERGGPVCEVSLPALIKVCEELEEIYGEVKIDKPWVWYDKTNHWKRYPNKTKGEN